LDLVAVKRMGFVARMDERDRKSYWRAGVCDAWGLRQAATLTAQMMSGSV